MRITQASQELGTSPRMLRYREMLGLLPPVREPAATRELAATRGLAPVREPAGARERAAREPVAARRRPPARRAPGHRQFGDDDLAAVALALQLEQRYDISPAALAFGLRVLTDPGARAEVAELGRRIGRIRPLPARALEFEKERALRLLSLTPPQRPRG